MQFTCGPESDKRSAIITLPDEPKKIGVLVSGGLDSAILYYLILAENEQLGNIHEIVPLTVLRKEGSKNFAKLVVAHVNDYFKKDYVDPIIVGDPSLPEEEQVKSGVLDAVRLKIYRVYCGIIEQLPQHMVDWYPIPYKESKLFKAPLAHLNKSHIVDLIVQLNQTALFHITHSCSAHEISRCRNCNGCNERQWAFEQLGLIDPGTI